MVVGRSDGLKDLHVETSFDNLRKRAQEHESKINLAFKESYFTILDGMHIKINEAYSTKDQEMEYIYLFRYIQVITKMITTPSNKKDGKRPNMKIYQNNSNKHMNRLEELEPVLKQRYVELESKKSLNSAKSASIYTDLFTDPVTQPAPRIIQPEMSFVSGEANSCFVECGQLHSLLKCKAKMKETLLIIDCRALQDYKQSRIKFDNVVHIPQNTIRRGMSASLLEHEIDKDSKARWGKRHSFDTVLLMDRDSTVDKMINNPLLHIVILKEILTQWDIKGAYKCLAILEGGFDEFESRYPQYSTNPVRISPPKITNPADLLNNFNYPEVPGTTPKKAPEPVKPVVPSFDRHIKPKAAYSALKEFKEQEKSKEGNGILSNRESTEPAINASEPMETDNINTNLAPNETSTLPVPSITRVDIPHKDNEGGDVAMSSRKGLVDEEMEQDEQGDGLLTAQQKNAYINNLRKVKPKTSENRPPNISVVNDTRMDYSSSSDDEESVPLKSDGVGSGMKRSLSSPNITKVKDDDMVSPMFSRSNKPCYSPRVQQTPSLLLGENPDAVYGNTQLGLTGLKNFANNCYMNSIIQCLSNTAPLVQELTNFSSKKPAVNTNSTTKGQIANVFIAALHSIWSGDVRIYSIRELKNLMGNYKEIFKGANHQDSHEFLIILLEYLHDDLNLPSVMTVLTGAKEESGERAWGEFRKKNDSIIQRLFYGQEQSSVTCTACRHRSVTFDHFFNLSVPIPDADKTTLEECIQVYLSGENIIWTCPKCKVDRNAVKKLDITRLPPILIIALKRFSHEVSWLEKKETLVTYPLENLELRHLTLMGSEHRHTTYNLHALSTHTGTLRTGHYRAICQNHISNKWYLFDDTSIHSISAQEVRNNPEVYILFYHAVK